LLERDSRKILKRLKDDGFELISAPRLASQIPKGEVVLIVPHPEKDLPIGTARAIAKQAGWIKAS
jgi:predicted RNA binding protein YcfA (HicA-like mRNA interferase family)